MRSVPLTCQSSDKPALLGRQGPAPALSCALKKPCRGKASLKVRRACLSACAGVGETVEDLQPFSAEAFVDALFPEL